MTIHLHVLFLVVEIFGLVKGRSPPWCRPNSRLSAPLPWPAGIPPNCTSLEPKQEIN